MLRNKEFRWFVFVFFLLAAVTLAAGFIIGTAAFILVLVTVALFGTAFFVFTRARYKSIAQISEQIDLVLHNEERLYIGESDEGELSILHSEITKMIQRIREQNMDLKKEKEHLADSLADVAHQLRTPLTSANLTLSLLGEEGDEKERKAFIRETEELLMRMDWLITSLLKLSRLDAGIVVFQSGQTKVNELISEALRPFLITMELHNIEVCLELSKDGEIQGDVRWLSEAVQNILKNCIESAGENGKIEITCGDNPLFTEILIHDSGSGFSKEEIPRLFERFYRGKNTDVTGYGIGLALSKMIITRQGGTITAKNHPAGGAVFAIRFPK